MMKAILGSALGGLVAGAVALVASAQSRAPEPAWSQPQVAPTPYALPVGDPRMVPTALSAQPGAWPAQYGALAMPAALTPQPGAVAAPAVVYVPAAYSQPDIVERPVARTQVVRPRASRVAYQREQVRSKRTWQKSALVIGGSAGAGAGIGAIAGGKKGALIGAAIGGGSGAIYEAIKRR